MNSLTTRYQIELIQRSAYETTARSIDVLNLIEQTIDMVTWIAERAGADAKLLHLETEKIQSAHPCTPIDPDDLVCPMLEAVQYSAENAYKLFVAKRNAALGSPDLLPDDGVVEAYTAAINNLGDLHDALDSLRWAVMTHDSEIDTVSGVTVTSAAALFARIGL
ncbi:hypothetical protein [Propionivibrio sp.]|uniref:hypothetical protein n=1 Tax=Propionivibrio sp. TaxID=2212460 RepID=UPI003BEF795B